MVFKAPEFSYVENSFPSHLTIFFFYIYEPVYRWTLEAVSAIAIVSIRRFINIPVRWYLIPSIVLQETDWILLFPKQLNVLQ